MEHKKTCTGKKENQISNSQPVTIARATTLNFVLQLAYLSIPMQESWTLYIQVYVSCTSCSQYLKQVKHCQNDQFLGSRISKPSTLNIFSKTLPEHAQIFVW